MDNNIRNLSFISYNCQHADDVRLPHLQELFGECDFLLIQEHGLRLSDLNWFDRIDESRGVCKHGVSAMEEGQILRGRPFGGVAIIWSHDLSCKVTPIPYESKRFCAVKVEFEEQSLLLICSYMPCDDWCRNQNINEDNDILNDIVILSNSIDVDFICIGGDFNTDITRNNYQTLALNTFIHENNLNLCANDVCCNVDFTFRSKGTGAVSLIDHFILSDNIFDRLMSFESIDSINNFSDHVAVKCAVELEVSYSNTNVRRVKEVCKPAWNKASSMELKNYISLLDEFLKNIIVPVDAISCTNPFCNTHSIEISIFHDSIIKAMVEASDASIPQTKSNGCKKVPGWNEYVDKYYKAAMFWHTLWVNNERPSSGIIAELRRLTRSQYHKAFKYVIREEGEVRFDNTARLLKEGLHIDMWREIRKSKKNGKNIPKSVDGASGHEDISNLFADKSSALYNCVGYDKVEMDKLKEGMDNRIRAECLCGNCSLTNKHSVDIEDVKQGIRKMKKGKTDGSNELMSDHIIHSGNRLQLYLSYLYTVMIGHGMAPDDLVSGTMVPLLKGKLANATISDNYRAITLSSLLGKLLEIIIMNKEEKNLKTSNLQFSFKKNHSTGLCTCMVLETVGYFVSNKTNVYGLLLDASKAFDRINYVKLFEKLLSRKICPLLCRLLLNMYLKQKLRVQFDGQISDIFSVSNGVKQGGIISPILYCIYVDDLLVELENNGIGCFVGSIFSGAYAYADDITLLAPSVSALRNMLEICVRYARDHDILFNSKKSQLIIFKHSKNPVPDPKITVNGEQVKVYTSVTHLGHVMNENIFNYDSSRIISNFNKQCNGFLADFKFASADLRNALFGTYCTDMYGAQLLPLHDVSFNDLLRAWRVAIRRVWRVPWRTHSSLLPHLAGVMSPELWLHKRTLNFINMGMNSYNINVKTILNIASHNVHSIFGSNVRTMAYKYDLNPRNITRSWKVICREEDNHIRIASHIKELCIMRDRNFGQPITSNECKEIIAHLCLD